MKGGHDDIQCGSGATVDYIDRIESVDARLALKRDCAELDSWTA